MFVKEILDKLKKAVVSKKYDLEHDKGAPWVDLYTDSMFLGELNDFSRMLTNRFGMDSSHFYIFSLKEEEIGIGFFLPYLRVLKKDEVRAKYIYIESEFQGYFPPLGKRFVLVSDRKRYDALCDVNNRIYHRLDLKGCPSF